MYTIDIADNQTLLDLDEEFLREVAGETLKAEQISDAEISIALVDDATIHSLNKRHLQHDYPTDVLSFLFAGDREDAEENRGGEETRFFGKTGFLEDHAQPTSRGRGKIIDGEIVVSVETALKAAADCGWSPLDEVVLYVVHGILHLVGYDDVDDAERQLMRTREREILARWHLTPGVDS